MNTDARRLLPIGKVEDKVGFKRSKVYRLIREGKFPTGRMIQGQRLWLESELDDWISSEWLQAS